MKTPKLIILTLISAIHATILNAVEISYEFTDVDSYHDFSYAGMSEEKTLDLFKRVLESEKNSTRSRSLPEDATVKIKFLDIDMAGDIQPWRNSTNSDVRYIQEVYPPRMQIEYSVIDKNGEVLKSGKTTVADLDFLWDIGIRRSDPFYYEMKMIKNWIRKIEL